MTSLRTPRRTLASSVRRTYRPRSDRTDVLDHCKEDRPYRGAATVPGMTTSRTLALGDTDVVRIGLGTNRLTNTREHVRFVREAVAAGLDHIDTAHLYTSGESEEAIGAAITGSGAACVVATKGGYQPGTGTDGLRREIEQSLRRLRTD